VSEKAKDAVDRAAESLKQTSATAANQVQQVGVEIRDKANDVKSQAAQSLKQAAENLRHEVKTTDGRPVAQAESFAQQLEKMASYLDDSSFEEIETDVRTTIQRNPWQSVGVSLAIGWVLSRLFGGRRH